MGLATELFAQNSWVARLAPSMMFPVSSQTTEMFRSPPLPPRESSEPIAPRQDFFRFSFCGVLFLFFSFSVAPYIPFSVCGGPVPGYYGGRTGICRFCRSARFVFFGFTPISGVSAPTRRGLGPKLNYPISPPFVGAGHSLSLPE